MQRLSMLSLVKEGEPIFSKDFCDFFKIKIKCRAQFLKIKNFKDPMTQVLEILH